jgi:hypothetical protein
MGVQGLWEHHVSGETAKSAARATTGADAAPFFSNVLAFSNF